jgi:hypothetical protein
MQRQVFLCEVVVLLMLTTVVCASCSCEAAAQLVCGLRCSAVVGVCAAAFTAVSTSCQVCAALGAQHPRRPQLLLLVNGSNTCTFALDCLRMHLLQSSAPKQPLACL